MNQRERDAFWTEYDRRVAELYPPVAPGQGVSEEDAAAEKRLGTRLPELLREFYLRVGKRRDLMGRQDYFIPVHELELSYWFPGRLQILSENQGTFGFLVELRPDADDPQVFFESEGGNGLEPHGSLPGFLVYAIYEHAANGEAAIAAIADVDSRVVEVIRREWCYVGKPVADWDEFKVYYRAGRVLEIAELPGEALFQVSAGARSESDLDDLARQLVQCSGKTG